MILCVLAALAGVWYSLLSQKSESVSDELAQLSKRELVAKTAMDKAPEIKAELERIQKAFDKSKTLNATDLQITAEECARNAGFMCTLSSSTTKDAGKFKINTITLSGQKVPLKTCSDFEKEIRLREPYIAISKASFDGDGKGAVNARYLISSFSF